MLYIEEMGDLLTDYTLYEQYKGEDEYGGPIAGYKEIGCVKGYIKQQEQENSRAKGSYVITYTGKFAPCDLILQYPRVMIHNKYYKVQHFELKYCGDIPYYYQVLLGQ